jgi:hypothetical protein
LPRGESLTNGFHGYNSVEIVGNLPSPEKPKIKTSDQNQPRLAANIHSHNFNNQNALNISLCR